MRIIFKFLNLSIHLKRMDDDLDLIIGFLNEKNEKSTKQKSKKATPMTVEGKFHQLSRGKLPSSHLTAQTSTQALGYNEPQQSGMEFNNYTEAEHASAAQNNFVRETPRLASQLSEDKFRKNTNDRTTTK